MNPFISQSERDIRKAVIDRARELWPTARIIHELNVEHGAVRADLAAVTETEIVLFEIKSERDTLHRLSNQLRHFQPVAHHLIVAAHERWCRGSRYPNCDIEPILRHAQCGASLWQYPEPEGHWGLRHWSAPHTVSRPWPHRLLHLLWTEELRSVAAGAGMAKVSRRSGYALADELAMTMKGRDIERAVCAALRGRDFAEADAPVVTPSAEARHAS